jgi:hypothetical protein
MDRPGSMPLRRGLSEEEGLIGVVSSSNLSMVGESGIGLVFTRDRVIGARRPEGSPELLAYTGPGSGATDAERSSSAIAAMGLLGPARFELPRNSVAQILFRPPRFMSGGSVIFKGSLQRYKVEMPSPSAWNEWSDQGAEVILRCLLAFAPGRLYDGRTGRLLVEERLRAKHPGRRPTGSGARKRHLGF